MNFKDFKLDPRLTPGLQAAGFNQATPIQSAAIPVVMQGKDLIGTAQTGTGKTAAFVLPVIHRLLQTEQGGQTRALIITPTRELAEQIHTVVKCFTKNTFLRSAVVYGGVGMHPQIATLRQGYEIIIACPGRLLDHMQKATATFNKIETLVLDEADRMLDMGFLPDIKKIINRLPHGRQTLLFSATFDAAMEKLISSALQTPLRLKMDTIAPATTISHALYPIAWDKKNHLLSHLLKETDAQSILIFTRTKHRADRVVKVLARNGHQAEALHGNKSQIQRQRTLERFRSGKLTILVATDIAARGLDISSVSHVINYDIPDSATTYIHRIGRTGRAARSGDALTMVTWADIVLVAEIEKKLGAPITRKCLEGVTDDSMLALKASKPKEKMMLRHRTTQTVHRRF